MLTLNNVEVVYSNVILVLRGVSLQAPEGKIVAILGANGAGKTTTLKAISGLLKTELGEVTDGSILFHDQRIENGDPVKVARMGIIQIMEERRVFKHLTSEENLIAGANLRQHVDVKKEIDMVYSYFPRLKIRSNESSGYLSGGEQQMLVMGRAMMAAPKIMLMDEPSLGLAPLIVQEIYGITKTINKEQNTSILLVEQNASVALSIADYGYVMENGRIVLDGTADKLRDNEDIKEFYMGLSELGERKSYREVKHYKRRKRWLG